MQINDKEILFRMSLLIFKSLSGNITKEEQAELDTWREENECNQKLFEQICSETMIREKFDQYKNANVQPAFDAFVKKIEKLQSRRHWIGTLSRYAAVVIVLVLVVVFYYSRKEMGTAEQLQFTGGLESIQRNLPVLTLSNGREMVLDTQELLQEENGARISVNKEGYIQYDRVDSVSAEVVYNTLSTPSQCDFTFILEDGTRVWMNAKSSLRYPVAFHGKERIIYAEGEIYLEVAKDERRPFFVILDGMKVEVLGTSFNINSYADEKYAEVTLVEGRVATYVNTENYCLLPNRQLRWDKENKTVEVKPVNVNDYIAWKNGKYIFKERVLSDIAKVLRRWYDVEVVFKNIEQENSIYTGVINKEERLDVFIKRLNETSSFNCRLEDNCVFIE